MFKYSTNTSKIGKLEFTTDPEKANISFHDPSGVLVLIFGVPAATASAVASALFFGASRNIDVYTTSEPATVSGGWKEAKYGGRLEVNPS